jgi:hydrogenase maturation protein HypF
LSVPAARQSRSCRRSACDIEVTGRVQGVGYRPFVYRKARELGVTGWVLNGAGKVRIHAEGDSRQIEGLKTALTAAAPPLARPRLAASRPVDVEGFTAFEIRESESGAMPEIHVPPDLYTCPDCIAELTDPAERRHDYPFINCTQCGPRYTIITAMPYDRPNTSMAGFPLCDACRAEYESPADRRFHAQPLACADCGPQLEFVTGGSPTTGNRACLELAVDALRRGQVLAIKGVGGYHLVCDAADTGAVNRLRERKHRPHKPLAVMFPIRGEDALGAVREHVLPSAEEAGLIADPARPIVLVKKRPESTLAPGLAPGLDALGAFLPYSPLHHRLLAMYGRPVVATSGNLSGEPVLTDNDQAQRRLGPICDALLHHDRPIVRPADDPVIRVIVSQPQLVRPGRGIAPLELELPDIAIPEPMVAVGGHMKNTVALAWDGRVVLSPHIGELDSPRSQAVFAQVIADLQALYGVESRVLVGDAHPGYASTRWAARQVQPFTPVFHHHAHASALAGEHPDIDAWLVFTWDGVGFGEDGSLWGGEAFLGGPGHWRRAASFRPFLLGGGDRAGREPWRSAAALLWSENHEWDPGIEGAALARSAWNGRLGTHWTSAAGRLFDAAAALVLGRHSASFEGQGPMELEALAAGAAGGVRLPLAEDAAGILRADWAAMLPLLLDKGIPQADRAAAFHDSMALALVEQAKTLAARHRFTVGLTGGVFQNRVLTERVVELLGAAGIGVRVHSRVPANDGGLCFGQVIEACAGQYLA